jgi:hypothetical protein
LLNRASAASAGTEAKNALSTCSTVAIACGASRAPRRVTWSFFARVSCGSIAFDERFALEASDDLGGHLLVGRGVLGELVLVWSLASVGAVVWACRATGWRRFTQS